jgi:hypothetical protein
VVEFLPFRHTFEHAAATSPMNVPGVLIQPEGRTVQWR